MADSLLGLRMPQFKSGGNQKPLAQLIDLIDGLTVTDSQVAETVKCAETET